MRKRLLKVAAMIGLIGGLAAIGLGAMPGEVCACTGPDYICRLDPPAWAWVAGD